MFNPSAKWPFGLTRSNLPIFVLMGALAVVLLVCVADWPVTVLVAQLPEWCIAPFRTITRAGRSDWILLPAMAIAVIAFATSWLVARFGLRDKFMRVASIAGFVVVGVGVPGILALLLKRIIGRARPVRFDEFGIWHFEPNLADWTHQSFPSGDTITIFAFAAVIAFIMPRLKYWAVLGAALVALSRIMVGMHFPADVLGGILVGILGAYAVRNFYASRHWVFETDEQGNYALKSGL